MSALVPQQPNLRAFVVFDKLPAGCIAFPIVNQDSDAHRWGGALMATVVSFKRPAGVANPSGFTPPASTFDPVVWLAAWSDHGGIAMLVNDRLWVSRLTAIDRSAATALDTLRGHLHRPGAPDALAGLLRANAGGMR